jgi:hypothetical protein
MDVIGLAELVDPPPTPQHKAFYEKGEIWLGEAGRRLDHAGGDPGEP